MNQQQAWKAAYRFVRADGGEPWDEAMRPFKQAALDAAGSRDARGRNTRFTEDEMDVCRWRRDLLILDLADRRVPWG